ncbi:DNA polymerase III subunit gamma and tau [Amycolatopsis taiwanensis]|uniref:DNA polymerase III subunit gamma/tau n=1 Tax=Amycolatopsis taiwanensis TaxID=342230 RepID=A0A9W6R6V5_9PSEU|nr:DNA polymerase III subunit gamma and tau [Amycolatopsis taiwanensis]GLY68687.1 DNA polymerase III subunit gamma and tau [Amycolatopsis taiwanensis]
MALALYRKYRPATFAEVVGQEHVTEPLRTALASGRINHAYLFSGPRGCGKTSSARIMARSLNCAEGPTPDPCGKCDSCRALAPEGPGSIDVTELDAASHGGVDDARELRDRAFYAPAESRYRVFIIDEAHMVTTQGFNALLKIVEEPPEHLIFIFATTEPDKVLPTIRSRTHHYPFRLIPPSAMRELLERNVAAEGIEVDPAVYPLVIRAGGGSARDTQSVLDQLLAGAGPEGVDYHRAVALLGVTDVALIDDLIKGLAEEDSAAVFGTVERLAEAGHDPRRFASDLLDRLRDLILVRSVPDAASRGLVSAPEDELARMTEQAGRLGLGTLTRYAEIVHNGLLEMRGATAPRLLLELLCARMMLPSVSTDQAALLQRLEQLERRPSAAPVSAGGATPGPQPPASSAGTAPKPPAHAERSFQRPSQRAAAEPPPARPSQPAAQARTAPPVSAPVPESAPVAEPSPPAATGAVDATAIRRVWPDLLAAIRKTSRSTEAMLTHATVQSVDGSTVVLAHTAEPLARRLSEPRNTDFIAAALHEVLGGTWQVRCVHAGGGGGAGRGPAGPRPQPNPPPRAAAPERSYQRPAQPAPAPAREQAPPEPDIPLPPEPEDDDSMFVEEPSGVAEISLPAESLDAEAVAHRLLAEHLGARPID